MVSSFKPRCQLFREFKSALESALLELLGTSDIPSDWDKPFQNRYKFRRADKTFLCHLKHVFVCLMQRQAWLCALDTEGSRQSAKLLRGRTACVDITEAEWNTGDFFFPELPQHSLFFWATRTLFSQVEPLFSIAKRRAVLLSDFVHGQKGPHVDIQFIKNEDQ